MLSLARARLSAAPCRAWPQLRGFAKPLCSQSVAQLASAPTSERSRRTFFTATRRALNTADEITPASSAEDPRIKQSPDGQLELFDVDAPLPKHARGKGDGDGDDRFGDEDRDGMDDLAGLGLAEAGPALTGEARKRAAAEEGRRRAALMQAKKALGPGDWEAVWAALDQARRARAARAAGGPVDSGGGAVGPVDESRPLFSYGFEEWARLRRQLEAAGRWESWRRAALGRLAKEKEALLREGYIEEDMRGMDLTRWPGEAIAKGDRRMRRAGSFREDRMQRRAPPAWARDPALPLTSYGAPLGGGVQAGLSQAELERRGQMERAAGLGRNNPNPLLSFEAGKGYGADDLDLSDAASSLPPKELLQPAVPSVCPLCRDDAPPLTFKNTLLLSMFTSESGRIAPRTRTGTCAKHQRALAREIKRARVACLIPFVSRLPRFRGYRLPPLPGTEREELARYDPSFAPAGSRLRPWSPLAPPAGRPWEEPIEEREEGDEWDEEDELDDADDDVPPPGTEHRRGAPAPA